MLNRVQDLQTLLKIRLIVGRFGEMDMAKWWNTQGMLGSNGARLLSRGIPRTHLFAQARVVFEVASNRCRQIFSEKGCYTLWQLPAEIEDQFQDKWLEFLEQDGWEEIFQNLADMSSQDLSEILLSFDLVSQEHVQKAQALDVPEGQPFFSLGEVESFTLDTIKILAAGFTKVKLGQLVVPYVQIR